MRHLTVSGEEMVQLGDADTVEKTLVKHGNFLTLDNRAVQVERDQHILFFNINRDFLLLKDKEPTMVKQELPRQKE